MVLAAARLGRKRRLHTLRIGNLQRTVYLIGGNMIEAARDVIPGLTGNLIPGRLPAKLRSLQERQRAHHIGLGKGERVLDRTVDVAFGSQVDDAVDFLLLHQLQDSVEIADIHLHEAIVRLVFDVLEIGQIAGIRKFIEIDDPILRILVHKQPHDVRPDKTGSAGDDDGTFHKRFSGILTKIQYSG